MYFVFSILFPFLLGAAAPQNESNRKALPVANVEPGDNNAAMLYDSDWQTLQSWKPTAAAGIGGARSFYAYRPVRGSLRNAGLRLAFVKGYSTGDSVAAQKPMRLPFLYWGDAEPGVPPASWSCAFTPEGVQVQVQPKIGNIPMEHLYTAGVQIRCYEFAPQFFRVHKLREAAVVNMTYAELNRLLATLK